MTTGTWFKLQNCLHGAVYDRKFNQDAGKRTDCRRVCIPQRRLELAGFCCCRSSV